MRSDKTLMWHIYNEVPITTSWFIGTVLLRRLPMPQIVLWYPFVTNLLQQKPFRTLCLALHVPTTGEQTKKLKMLKMSVCEFVRCYSSQEISNSQCCGPFGESRTDRMLASNASGGTAITERQARLSFQIHRYKTIVQSQRSRKLLNTLILRA